LIVGSAAERDVVDGRGPVLRVRLDVVETAGSSAPSTSARPSRRTRTGRRRVSRQPALRVSAPPSRAAAACGCRSHRLATDTPIWPRLRGDTQLLVLDLREQERYRAVEDDARVTVWDLAAQERLELQESLVRRLTRISGRRGGIPRRGLLLPWPVVPVRIPVRLGPDDVIQVDVLAVAEVLEALAAQLAPEAAAAHAPAGAGVV